MSIENQSLQEFLKQYDIRAGNVLARAPKEGVPIGEVQSALKSMRDFYAQSATAQQNAPTRQAQMDIFQAYNNQFNDQISHMSPAQQWAVGAMGDEMRGPSIVGMAASNFRDPETGGWKTGGLTGGALGGMLGVFTALSMGFGTIGTILIAALTAVAGGFAGNVMETSMNPPLDLPKAPERKTDPYVVQREIDSPQPHHGLPDLGFAARPPARGPNRA